MTDKVRIGIYIGGAGIPDASDMPYCNGIKMDLPENWLSLPEDERLTIAENKCATMGRMLVNWFDERLAEGAGK